jgi:hypothetical protein
MIDPGLELMCGMTGLTCPGECVRAFFDFAESVPAGCVQDLSKLASLIQGLVVIEALDSGDQLLETVPFEPALDDTMESYCQRVLQMFQLDRVYETPRLKLRFCYR